MASHILIVIPDEMLTPTMSILGQPPNAADQPPLQIGSGDDEYACGWSDTVLAIGGDPRGTYGSVAMRCPASGKYTATGDEGVTRTPANAEHLDPNIP